MENKCNVWWPDNFWTVENVNVHLNWIKHTIEVTADVLCGGDEIDSMPPKGIWFSASFDSVRKMSKIVCEDDDNASTVLASYISNRISEEMAKKIADDYIHNIKISREYNKGKDEVYVKDYCIERLATDQKDAIQKMNEELIKKLIEIL